jgi:hypothetical protein
MPGVFITAMLLSLTPMTGFYWYSQTPEAEARAAAYDAKHGLAPTTELGRMQLAASHAGSYKVASIRVSAPAFCHKPGLVLSSYPEC